jgi:hypothetical protein
VAAVRTAYRAWADGQHDMLTWTEGRLGMSYAEYAEAMQRVALAHAGELELEVVGLLLEVGHLLVEGVDVGWRA